MKVTRWDLREVHVKDESDVVKVRWVSPLLPVENTVLILKFIEGVMDSLGYGLVKEDHLKGLILLEFKKT